jgi:hypothetical protein
MSQTHRTATGQTISPHRIARGLYAVPVRNRATGQILDFRIYGVRGAYTVDLYKIGGPVTDLGIATTLDAATRMIAAHVDTLDAEAFAAGQAEADLVSAALAGRIGHDDAEAVTR